MRKIEDFQKSVKENNIDYWPIHNCSMCDYECGYIFNFNGQEVVYDAGCDCVRGRDIIVRDWKNVLEQYNLNRHNPTTLKEYDEFWKFKDKTNE